MDAVEFLKAAQKRAKFNPDYYGDSIILTNGDTWELLVAQVEKWAKERPVKTRQSEFLKMFPNAFVEDDGCLTILPCDIDRTVKGACAKKTCSDCRDAYWLQEIE